MAGYSAVKPKFKPISMKLNHKIHNIKVSYILFNMCDIISLSKIKATTINPGLEACNKKTSIALLVCTWRQSGYVGGQEQKHFSPLGTKLYFHVNYSRKYSFVLTPNMAALSRGCKPRIQWEYSNLVTQHGMLSFYLHHFLAEYVIPYLLLYIPVD